MTKRVVKSPVGHRDDPILVALVPTKPEAEDRSQFRRVAERHGRVDLAIDPSLCQPFVDSLLTTVERDDPEFSPEVRAAGERRLPREWSTRS